MGWRDGEDLGLPTSPRLHLKKATGTMQCSVSPMTREPLSGMLLYTPRGHTLLYTTLGRQGRLGAGQDVDRGGVKEREAGELRNVE